MTLYKLTSYSNSVSLQEPEFRIAIQGGYDLIDVTFRDKNSFNTQHFVVKKEQFMRGVVNAKMRMTKAGFGIQPKPYWTVHF